MKFSAVIPVFNEAESLEAFQKELYEAMQKTSSAYEIIYVDDASTDSSLDILIKLAKNCEQIKIISFIGDAIVEFLILPINLVIKGINLLIRGINAVSGTKIKLIPEIGTQSFGLDLTEKVVRLQSRFQEDNPGKQQVQQPTINNFNVNGLFDESGMTRAIEGILKDNKDRTFGSPIGG